MASRSDRNTIPYSRWLQEFTTNKTLVATFDQSNAFAVHSIQRYMDEGKRFWEIAFTYTDRLVVRSGHLEADGITIQWGTWITNHDVLIDNNRQP